MEHALINISPSKYLPKIFCLEDYNKTDRLLLAATSINGLSLTIPVSFQIAIKSNIPAYMHYALILKLFCPHESRYEPKSISYLGYLSTFPTASLSNNHNSLVLLHHINNVVPQLQCKTKVMKFINHSVSW